MADKLRETRARVLEENTAQAVFKHLDRLRDSRKMLGPRWIWELLQNARDEARPGGVEIEIVQTMEALRFKHNGKSFSSEDITHLVYHGSTKLNDVDSVGHFGSGFISTHLLSRLVQVRGPLDDGQQFDFLLDRTGATVEELREDINQSWERFEQSICANKEPGAQTTEFEYALTDEASDLCTAGLNELEKCAPLVLAFSDEIIRISVKTPREEWSITRSSEQPLTPAVKLLKIAFTKGNDTPPILIGVVSKDGLQAAVPLCETSGGISVALNEHAPRVYILFPLLGTNRLMLPAAVNSKALKPLEDRNGLYLKDDEDGPKQNRRLLQDAVPLMIQLLEAAAVNKWAGTQHLLAFHDSSLPEWVDSAWFSTLAGELVRRALDLPLMPTLGEEWIAPKDAWIPSAIDDRQTSELWELAAKLSGAASKLPSRKQLLDWSRNASNWSRILAPGPAVPELFTVPVLARIISDLRTIEALQARLPPQEDAFDWLAKFLVLLQESGNTNLFDKLPLLPSQSGRFRIRTQLQKDMGIDGSLKDLARELGDDVRDSLLDSRAAVGKIPALLLEKQEITVLDQTLALLKKKIQNGHLPAALVPVDAALFWWVIARPSYHEKLSGFPVATADSDPQRSVVINLARDAATDRLPLAPSSVWPDPAKRHAELFPRQWVLAAAFANGHDTLADWNGQALRGYVHLGPLFQTERRKGAFLPIDPNLDSDVRKEHRATKPSRTSEIACLTEKDVGLIDTARKSRRVALRLVRFLVESILEADEQAFEQDLVPCECGVQHDIYRAAWLVPLRRRAWIQLGPDAGGRSAQVSAESLADLVREEPDLVKGLATPRGRRLLVALGMSPSDFALFVVAKDASSRELLIQSITELAAVYGDLAQVQKLATELREHPELIQTIKDARDNRELVRQNHLTGKLVEELLREELQAQGMKVEPTGVGSDFAVRSTITNDDSDVSVELSARGSAVLLEIKSTRGEHAKMTPRQVETACQERERFGLCVVALRNDPPTRTTVREHSRFLFGIGAELQPIWDDFKKIQSAEGIARQHKGPVVLELNQGDPRFLVGRELFSKGLSLAEAVAEFRRRSSS